MNIILSMSKYWIGGHTKYRLMYHIVWIPKYRKRILDGGLSKRLEELLKDCAEINGWKINELKVNKDHIHMLVELGTQISVCKAVQMFKGGSSKKLREEFPSLKEFLWGESFWADGYFAETIGKVDENKIKDYIQNQ